MRSCCTLLAMTVFSGWFGVAAAAAPVPLDFHFKLTDMADKPVPPVQVRVVFGAVGDWQHPDAGQVFTTDLVGEARFSALASIAKRSYKRPTNFVDSLFSRAEPTDYLPVALQLEYAGRQRLLVIKLYRFRSDGTVLLSGLGVYTPDAKGRFAVQGKKVNGYDWKIPEPDGLASGHPGFDVAEFKLGHDTGDEPWKLSLTLRRLPEPKRR